MAGRTYYLVPAALLQWRPLSQAGVLVTTTPTGSVEPADDATDGFTHTATMRLDDAEALVALRVGWTLPREWSLLAPVSPAVATGPEWESPEHPEPWASAPYAVLVPPEELTSEMAAASLVQHVVWARYVVPMRVEDGAAKCVLWYSGAKPAELEAYPRRYRSQVEALPVVEG